MADAVPSPRADDPEPGSPGWWSTRPVAPTGPRRGRPPRSLDQIVEAATELIDEVGPDAFSMRTLAERLGTSTATLYRHVTGKDELLVYAVEHFMAGLAGVSGVAVDLPSDWKDAARTAAVLFRATLSEHPNLLPLFVVQIPIGPHGLLVREAMLASLVHYDFTPDEAARVYTTLAHYVIGFTVQEHAAGAPGPEDTAALGRYYRSLDPALYPATVAAADALTSVGLDQEFLEGLDYLLDGIDRARAS